MEGAAWIAGGALCVLCLFALRRPLGALARLAARTGVGLAVLAAVSGLGSGLGITLGVNLANALVLGLLGVPGLGLLLMASWLFPL